METQGQEPIGKDAKEKNNLNSSKKINIEGERMDFSKTTETTKRERLDNSPFDLVYNEKDGWRLCIAEFAVTEALTEKQARGIAKKMEWGVIVCIVGAILEIQKRMEKENEEIKKRQREEVRINKITEN